MPLGDACLESVLASSAVLQAALIACTLSRNVVCVSWPPTRLARCYCWNPWNLRTAAEFPHCIDALWKNSQMPSFVVCALMCLHVRLMASFVACIQRALHNFGNAIFCSIDVLACQTDVFCSLYSDLIPHAAAHAKCATALLNRFMRSRTLKQHSTSVCDRTRQCYHGCACVDRSLQQSNTAIVRVFVC